jgi:hypothetical protein
MRERITRRPRMVKTKGVGIASNFAAGPNSPLQLFNLCPELAQPAFHLQNLGLEQLDLHLWIFVHGEINSAE